MLQQPLVDRAELLDGEVPVADVAPALRRPAARHRVHHGGERRVPEGDPVQQRRPPRIEEAAVVGRQAERRVALVNDPAEVADRVPVARRLRRERLPAVEPRRDVAPHPVAEADRPVLLVVHRQQAAVLGVEDEQQPVEQDQRRVPHLAERGVAGAGGDGADERREHLAEDDFREVGGDLLFEEPAAFEGAVEDVLPVGVAPVEGVAPEEEDEEGEGVGGLLGGGREERRRPAERRFEVHLEELVGDRAGVGVVEPPAGAVREDAPAEPTAGDDARLGEVAEHLGGGGDAVGAGGAVEVEAPALGLDEADAGGVAVRLVADAERLGLVGVGGVEDAVGDVAVSVEAEVLLAEGGGPAEGGEDLPDELVFGDGFVRVVAGGEGGADVVQAGGDAGGEVLPRLLPLGELADGLGEELAGEEAAGDGSRRVHAGRGAGVKKVRGPPVGVGRARGPVPALGVGGTAANLPEAVRLPTGSPPGSAGQLLCKCGYARRWGRLGAPVSDRHRRGREGTSGSGSFGVESSAPPFALRARSGADDSTPTCRGCVSITSSWPPRPL